MDKPPLPLVLPLGAALFVAVVMGLLALLFTLLGDRGAIGIGLALVVLVPLGAGLLARGPRGRGR